MLENLAPGAWVETVLETLTARWPVDTVLHPRYRNFPDPSCMSGASEYGGLTSFFDFFQSRSTVLLSITLVLSLPFLTCAA
jgi:hypothetical protein